MGLRGDVQIIRNAVDMDQFHFDREARGAYRKALELDGRYVVGFVVGRLHPQKNAMRLLAIFQALSEKRGDAALRVVGDGSLMPRMRQYVEERGLSDSVLFLGRRSDVNSLLSAMDVFVLPSVYEGLGLVVIEAQAAGLSCVKSAAVPAPDLTGRTVSLSLELEDTVWAEAIAEIRQCDRLGVRKQIRDAGYDIKSEAARLQAFYLAEAAKYSSVFWCRAKRGRHTAANFHNEVALCSISAWKTKKY